MASHENAPDAADVAQEERRRLCATLREVGPDAPTLCEGWVTRDLVAHLLVRERQPLAAAGIVLPFLSGPLAAAMRRTAARPWTDSIDSLASGPPRPMKWLDGQANLIEFVVHREDVRRGGGLRPAEDRDAGTLETIWQRLRHAAPLLLRGSDITLTWPGRGSIVVGRGTAQTRVQAGGSPVDLLLMATGRPADVEFTGPPAAIDRFRARKRGI